MKAKNTIFFGDPRADKLGITKAGFSDFFAWDCRPSCVAVMRLSPNSQQALEQFFQAAQSIYSVVEIWAPREDIVEASKTYHYEQKTDPAGNPYLTDEKHKLGKRK